MQGRLGNGAIDRAFPLDLRRLKPVTLPLGAIVTAKMADPPAFNPCGICGSAGSVTDASTLGFAQAAATTAEPVTSGADIDAAGAKARAGENASSASVSSTKIITVPPIMK